MNQIKKTLQYFPLHLTIFSKFKRWSLDFWTLIKSEVLSRNIFSICGLPQKSSRLMKNFHRNFSVTSHFRVRDDWLDFQLSHYLKATMKMMIMPPVCFPSLNKMSKAMLRMTWWSIAERGCPAAALRVWPWASRERTPIGDYHKKMLKTIWQTNNYWSLLLIPKIIH